MQRQRHRFSRLLRVWVGSLTTSNTLCCFSIENSLPKPHVSRLQLSLSFGSTAAAAAAPTAKDKLFNKILVANRGEIAVRIIRTARRLGIPTVAVYSDADANAVHTRFADEAVRIGPPQSTESYLNSDAIIEAVHRTGADGVHPGYGFLSENELFANAVSAVGSTFIGPPAHAMRAMGDKVESKRFAHAAGVNTIPGWVGVVEGVDHAIAVAMEIGFPVMVKASAGGGGKGMRIAWNEKDLAEGYKLATEEAASAFGDSRMLIEKFVERPRHVEIQVLGDTQGNVLYLPERECSIQRRNQKVIEEAPSPVATPDLRRAMGEQAVALCKAVGYYSAGTCEFLVDAHKNFYFLEMNTRLQVEHPITEAVTGLDLVEQMLRIAAGLPLEITQEDVAHPKGWAMECRIYAEDPARGFLPSTGRLKRYIEPTGHGVRVDSGVEEGSEISVYYDPMISKLVTHGPDRATALAIAARALDSYVIRGVQHNTPLLRSVLDAPDFVDGEISTAFLADHFPHADSSAPTNLPLAPHREEEAVALAAALAVWRDCQFATLESALGSERHLVVTSQDGIPRNVTVRPASSQMVPSEAGKHYNRPTLDSRSGRGFGEFPMALEIELASRILQVSGTPDGMSPFLVVARIDGSEALCQIISRGPRHVVLQYCGAQRRIVVDPPAAAALQHIMPAPIEEDLSKVARSPMPGMLISVAVAPGTVVEPGDELAVVEAMKMRNILRAEREGTVASVEASPGSKVAADQVVVRLE